MCKASLHFFLGRWQRDPHLQAVDQLAVNASLWPGALGMHDAASGGHPVDLAGLDRHGGAEAVTVHDLAIEEIGYGGEADMRVWANVETIARVEFRRSKMIEKDKWPNHAGPSGRQCTTDREVAEVHCARHDDLGNGVALFGVAGGRVLARKETHDELLLLLASQSEQPQRVTARNSLSLISRELGQPSAIFLEDRVVAEPALVDPGIRAEQEPVGITCK